MQKGRLQQQVLDLELEVATLQADKERLVREKLSAEAEVEKLAREGPGGNLGRLQQEIDSLSYTCKDLAAQRDQALHGAKASELAVRRKEAQWEQAQLQHSSQMDSTLRRLRAAEADTTEAKEEVYKLRTQVEVAERREKEMEVAMQRREAEVQERVQRLTDKCKEELGEMMERVRRAEEAEEASKSELSALLESHDRLQDKWREASRQVGSVGGVGGRLGGFCDAG